LIPLLKILTAADWLRSHGRTMFAPTIKLYRLGSLEKGAGSRRLTEGLIPLSLRDIPAQGTPYGRLFKGDIIDNL